MTIHLVDSLADDTIQLNDTLLISKGRSSIFQTVLKNCQMDLDSGRLLDLLYPLAATCSPLSTKAIAEICQLGISECDTLVKRLSDILVVSIDATENETRYSDCENFRAFISRTLSGEIALADMKLLNYCDSEFQSGRAKANPYRTKYYAPQLIKPESQEDQTELVLPTGDADCKLVKMNTSFGAKALRYKQAMEAASILHDREAMIINALHLVSLKRQNLDEINRILGSLDEGPLGVLDVMGMLERKGRSTKEEQKAVFLLYTLCLLKLTLFLSTDHPDRGFMIQQVINQMQENFGKQQNLDGLSFLTAHLIFFIISAIEDEIQEVDSLVALMKDWVVEEDPAMERANTVSGIKEPNPIKEGYWLNAFRSVDFLLDQKQWPVTDHDIRKEALEALKQASFIFNGCVTCEEISDLFIPTLDALEDKSLEDVDLELALADGFMVDEKDYMLRDISENLCLVGRHEDAIRVVKHMINDFQRNDALGTIVAACMKQGKFDQAMMTALSINNEIIGFGVYRDLALKCNELGWQQSVVEMVMKADAFVERVDPGIVRDFYFSELTDILLTQDLFDQAIDAVEKIENTPTKSLAMGKIVKGLSRTGKFDKALEFALDIDESEQRKDALFEIASKADKKGYFIMAQQVLRIIVNEAKTKKDDTSLEALYELRDLPARMTNLGFYPHSRKVLKEAIYITDRLKFSPSRINGELLLCGMLCEHGEFLQARERILLLEGIIPKISGLSLIVRSIHHQKKHSEALATLSMLRLLLNDRLEEPASADIYPDVALLYQELGFCEDAIANLVKACNYIKNISSDRIRRFEMAALAEKIINRGQCDWIKVISDFFQPGKVKEDFLNMSSYTLVKYGRHDMAMECASIMEDESKRNSAWIFISDAFSDEERHREAALAASHIIPFQERSRRLEKISIMAGRHDFIKYGLGYCLDQIESFWCKYDPGQYKRGIVSMLAPSSATVEVVFALLPKLTGDIRSIERVLKNYALNCLFFTNDFAGMITSVIREMNLDWAYDVIDEIVKQTINTTRT